MADFVQLFYEKFIQTWFFFKNDHLLFFNFKVPWALVGSNTVISMYMK